MNDMSLKISIIDYGVGNLHSLYKAVKQFANNVVITEEADTVNSSDALILPGVGAFASGMEGLKIRSLVEPVRNFAKANKPILGICLGAQLMMSTGHEFGDFKGLGLIKGKVVMFPNLPEHEKIPHIGWNKIFSPDGVWKSPILAEIPENANVYFVHSYILEPDKKENILSETVYGGYKFCSAVFSGNMIGCQFHPEKSGTIGLAILKNFIDTNKKSS